MLSCSSTGNVISVLIPPSFLFPFPYPFPLPSFNPINNSKFSHFPYHSPHHAKWVIESLHLHAYHANSHLIKSSRLSPRRGGSQDSRSSITIRTPRSATSSSALESSEVGSPALVPGKRTGVNAGTTNMIVSSATGPLASLHGSRCAPSWAWIIPCPPSGSAKRWSHNHPLAVTSNSANVLRERLCRGSSST
jgi:hypothetical protein